ncbi:MAG: N-formylglutamate amidohydrolase [Rhodobacteraceae bacterium]|nr:N-formylglutamate amidohydrolase [Paracoccaceae bacterium]
MSAHAPDLPLHVPLVENAAGRGAVVLVCEHASNAIPAGLADLGLALGDVASHAAWDPGALGVARAMGAALDAPLVAATQSRLVHDCNRPEAAPDAMPARTEEIAVPGNAGLSAAERAARGQRCYAPFHAAVSATLAGRDTPPVLVTVHSFTPRWHGVPRAVEIGILHDDDTRLADAMLARAGAHTDHLVARNEPYGPAHGVTHTLRLHGVENGRANVMLEIRNDLIADQAAQTRMGVMLAGLVRAALEDLGQGGSA